jgi:regulatory protein
MNGSAGGRDRSSRATNGAAAGNDQRTLELAYRYLNPRERSEAEVRAHLEGKGLPAGEVERTIATLRDQGYLDDARFARLLAQDKRTLEGWGSDRIRGTLSARGIDRELIEAALAGDDVPSAELDRAVAVLRRRFPAPPRERRERNRALAVLLRKGYDSELALQAMAQHASEYVGG